MKYNVVLTTAEDVVAVVDAVYASQSNSSKEFICEFTDLSDTRADNALRMAEQFLLVSPDLTYSFYNGDSFLARLLITTKNDIQKASIMRLVFEQYEPYIAFKSRFIFSGSTDSASKQIRALYSMQAQYKDIKNTIINIATYTKSMIDEGANIYKLNPDHALDINHLDSILDTKAYEENLLLKIIGENNYNKIDKANIYNPLSDALSKSRCNPCDPKSIVLYASSAFESFLVQLGQEKKIDLSGKSGIISKANALTLSKKHRGMIEYIGQVRNAAEHGADTEEGGNLWDISEGTARIYPLLVANVIRALLEYQKGNITV